MEGPSTSGEIRTDRHQDAVGAQCILGDNHGWSRFDRWMGEVEAMVNLVIEIWLASIAHGPIPSTCNRKVAFLLRNMGNSQ